MMKSYDFEISMISRSQGKTEVSFSLRFCLPVLLSTSSSVHRLPKTFCIFSLSRRGVVATRHPFAVSGLNAHHRRLSVGQPPASKQIPSVQCAQSQNCKDWREGPDERRWSLSGSLFHPFGLKPTPAPVHCEHIGHQLSRHRQGRSITVPPPELPGMHLGQVRIPPCYT